VPVNAVRKEKPPKYWHGQVVAHCFDFKDGSGEFVREYFKIITRALLEIVRKSRRTMLHRSGGTTYDRPLKQREYEAP